MLIHTSFLLCTVCSGQQWHAPDQASALYHLPAPYQAPALNQSPSPVRLSTLDHKPFNLSSLHKPLAAIVFLSPECPLCQNYSLVLNDLRERYKADLDILGIFPGKAYTREVYEGFRDKYHIRFPLLTDTSFGLVRQLAARVTPEVFLMDAERKICYHGLIDNWMAALGKQRNKATEHYLEDGIRLYLGKSPILVKSTKPIGCFINEY